MSQTVYVLIGIPGCGKSTWAKENIEENTIIVCKDNIRTMLKGKYTFDLKYEKFVERTAMGMLRKALKAGFDVIVDETHTTYGSRKKVVNTVQEYEDWFDEKINIVFVCFKVEPEKALKQRLSDPRGRDEKEWIEVHEKKLRSYKDPHEDNYSHAIEFMEI